MPDARKHLALAAAGFKLQPTCGTCVHWGGPINPPWGKCGMIRYDHAKHGEKRAGTPDVGHCNSYDPDLRAMALNAGDDYAARYMQEDEG